MRRRQRWQWWWVGWVMRELIEATMQRRLFGLASEMAYNAMLSLFPSILALLTAFGTFRAQETESMFRFLAGQLGRMVPEAARSLVEAFVVQIRPPSDRGLFSISFAIALWIASSAIGAAMNAFDEIHQIPFADRRPFWQAKLISLGLTLGMIGLIMVASFVVLTSDRLVQTLVLGGHAIAQPWLDRLLQIWQWLGRPAALIILAAAFRFLYRYGPSRNRAATPTWPGAMVGAMLWAGGSSLLRFYLLNFGQYNRIYGAIGAVIVLLWWLNWGSMAILIGAQFNVTLARLRH